MITGYPAAIDTWTPLTDNVDYPMAAYLNDLHNGIIALEEVLDVNPQGASLTVAARLDTLS